MTRKLLSLYVLASLTLLIVSGCSSKNTQSGDNSVTETQQATVETVTNNGDSAGSDIESKTESTELKPKNEENSNDLDDGYELLQNALNFAERREQLDIRKKMNDLLAQTSPSSLPVEKLFGNNLNLCILEVEFNGFEGCSQYLDFIWSQLERIPSETVSAEQLNQLSFGIAYFLDFYQLLPQGSKECSPFLENVALWHAKGNEAQKDGSKVFNKIQIPFSLAWNDVLNNDMNSALENLDKLIEAENEEYAIFNEEDEPIMVDPQQKEELKKAIEEAKAKLEEMNREDDPDGYDDFKENLETAEQFLLSLDGKEEVLDSSDGKEEVLDWTHLVSRYAGGLIAIASGNKEDGTKKLLDVLKLEERHTEESAPFASEILSGLKLLKNRGFDVDGLDELRQKCRERLGDKLERGIVVKEIVPDSVAEKAGVQVGDHLLSYDGEPVFDTRNFSYERLIDMAKKEERESTIIVLRGDEKIEIKVPAGRLGMTLVDPDVAE